MFDLTKIYYPTYIIGIPKATKCIYIPADVDLGLRDYSGKELNILKLYKLKRITDSVLEGYYVNDRLYFFDALPLKDFESNKCTIAYQDRRSLLRSILNDRLADYNTFTEAYTELVYYPGEIKAIYSKCVINGYRGCLIRSRYNMYSWGRFSDDNFELIPEINK
jgi:hypothetical protein